MVERLKTDIRPQLLLITGDITKDGELLSHEYVVGKLDELRAAGIKTLVIPGNHDLGTRNALSYDGATTTKAVTATADDFARLYARYGYGDGSEREGSTLTYCTEPVEGLVVIGIDSGENGWLSNMTLNWVCNKAEEAARQGKQVVAMMHHPLFPHFFGVDRFVKTAVIANYEQVRNRLADAGIRVIFTGHVHTSDIAKGQNGDLTRSIYDVNTGSLISYPCDYRVVTFSSDLRQLALTTDHVTALPGDAHFSDTARQRLTASIRSQVENMSSALNLFADQAAECFVVHAEGNEHRSERGQQLLAQLLDIAKQAEAYAALMPSIKQTVADAEKLANSVLRDISDYGDAKRQNQTDDLELTIEE
jgi:predicted phosphodiesterase